MKTALHSKLIPRPADLPVISPVLVQWPLDKLYAEWDQFRKAASHEGFTTAKFQGFPIGSPLSEIYLWFKACNPRFNLGDVIDGHRLVPLTSGRTRLPVFDRNGVQICLFDVLRVEQSSSVSGMVALRDVVLDKYHLPFGGYVGMSRGEMINVDFNPFILEGVIIGYHCSVAPDSGTQN